MMKTEADNIFENCLLLNDKISDLPNSAGLVFFADSGNQPIVLLTAANIKRTVKTKLAEKIEPNKRADLKSITAKIYYSACRCKFRQAVKHLDTAKKIFEEKYEDYITLVYPWYLTVNLDDRIPFFCVTKKPAFKDSEKILGPFPTQKTATVFMTILEDVFRLCRKSEFVNNPQYAKSCPYLQMGACVGVCGGKISREEYKKIIEDAFKAGVNPAGAVEKFQSEMQTAAKELIFEKAEQLKKNIEKLSALKKQSYRWTGDLKKLKIVHIDKSDKIRPEGSKTKKQTYAVFVMNFSQITDLGDFLPDNPETINNAVNTAVQNLSESPDNNAMELFSVVTYFLYRSKPTGLWVNALERPDEKTREWFLKEKPPTSFGLAQGR